MSKTPEEAEKLWCPMARVLGPAFDREGEVLATNRPLVFGGSFSQATACIGPACMMWAWQPPRRGRELRRVLVSQSKARPGKGSDWLYEQEDDPERPGDKRGVWVQYEQIPVGDCGLKAPEFVCGYETP